MEQEEKVCEKIDHLTMAVLLLAKMVAKTNNVKLTKNDKIAFSQISPTGIPAFLSLIDNSENI